jgi:hypothetical protein
MMLAVGSMGNWRCANCDYLWWTTSVRVRCSKLLQKNIDHDETPRDMFEVLRNVNIGKLVVFVDADDLVGDTSVHL